MIGRNYHLVSTGARKQLVSGCSSYEADCRLRHRELVDVLLVELLTIRTSTNGAQEPAL